MPRLRQSLEVLGLAVLLTVVFWGPLWIGYGLIGGDLYPYFFPQKVLLAESLRAGALPLWNPWTGFGYPVLGESQTGGAYPPYLLTYAWLDVNTAYNVQHLAHYILCFWGTWQLARRLGTGPWGAILSALVFTYGWFPPRACLEWAIVTGAWMPWALWCTAAFAQTGQVRYGVGLSVCLGLQMLAGHFHLAFITQLLVASFGLWEISRRGPNPHSSELSDSRKRAPGRWVGWLGIFVGLGFGVAAIQLLPAWELKTRSTRASVGPEHDPSYGHLPPLYLSQVIAPWLWYSPQVIGPGSEFLRTTAEFAAPWHWFGPEEDLDQRLMRSRAGGLTTVATNKVEAHLYAGLVPLGLAAFWLIGRLRRSPPDSRRDNDEADARLTLFWIVAGGLAAIYATGWLLPIARWLPGFNFFRGPGRYGIVTTLALAILAGRGLSRIEQRPRGLGRIALLGLLMVSTWGDLWLVSRMVGYALMIPNPPLAYRNASPLRHILNAESEPPRLYAPGQNLGNLLGVSCLPVYLGIAPAEYQDPKYAGAGFPRESGPRGIPADPTFSAWLRDAGVTHILSERPLDATAWQVEPLWQGVDPLWNSAWGRVDPLYLYRLQNSIGRLAGPTLRRQDWKSVTPNRVHVVVETDAESTVELKDLSYPGWTVFRNGQPLPQTGPRFRSVQIPAGISNLEWVYAPQSVRWGGILSGVAILVLIAVTIRDVRQNR